MNANLYSRLNFKGLLHQYLTVTTECCDRLHKTEPRSKSIPHLWRAVCWKQHRCSMVVSEHCLSEQWVKVSLNLVDHVVWATPPWSLASFFSAGKVFPWTRQAVLQKKRSSGVWWAFSSRREISLNSVGCLVWAAPPQSSMSLVR